MIAASGRSSLEEEVRYAPDVLECKSCQNQVLETYSTQSLSHWMGLKRHSRSMSAIPLGARKFAKLKARSTHFNHARETGITLNGTFKNYCGDDDK